MQYRKVVVIVTAVWLVIEYCSDKPLLVLLYYYTAVLCLQNVVLTSSQPEVLIKLDHKVDDIKTFFLQIALDTGRDCNFPKPNPCRHSPSMQFTTDIWQILEV